MMPVEVLCVGALVQEMQFSNRFKTLSGAFLITVCLVHHCLISGFK